MLIILINGNAGWVRHQPKGYVQQTFSRLVGSAGQVIQTHCPEDVKNILTTLNPAHITALMPVGGDGTLSATLSSACACWGAEHLPPVLPVCAGTMNMVALAVLGRREQPHVTLTRVLHALRSNKHLPCIQLGLLQTHTGHVGFAAGFGIPTRFLSYYYAHGGGHWQALKAILRYSGSVLSHGTLARELFETTSVRLTVDDAPTQHLQLSLLLAMTINTLPLGFQVGLDTQGNREDFINLVKGLVRHHLHDQRIAERIASRLNISERTLHRRLKDNDTSLRKLIIEERLTYAEHQLKRTDDSVQLIAMALGYDDPSNFIRFFKQHREQTPQAFRLHFR